MSDTDGARWLVSVRGVQAEVVFQNVMMWLLQHTEVTNLRTNPARRILILRAPEPSMAALKAEFGDQITVAPDQEINLF